MCTSILFFFNDTATTEIYTLSLHDALPIYHPADHDHPDLPRAEQARDDERLGDDEQAVPGRGQPGELLHGGADTEDRKSTRLNSSHGYISYAVFCLKKKHKIHQQQFYTQLS